MQKSLYFVLIFTAFFLQSHEFPKKILKSAEINIYTLHFVVFMLANFRQSQNSANGICAICLFWQVCSKTVLLLKPSFLNSSHTEIVLLEQFSYWSCPSTTAFLLKLSSHRSPPATAAWAMKTLVVMSPTLWSIKSHGFVDSKIISGQTVCLEWRRAAWKEREVQPVWTCGPGRDRRMGKGLVKVQPAKVLQLGPTRRY